MSFNNPIAAEMKVRIEGQRQMAFIRQEVEKAKSTLFEQKGFVEKCLEQEKEKVFNWVTNQIARVQEEEIKLRGQKEELRVEILHFRKLVADVKETELVAKKLFQDMQKANEEMLTNLKRSHEVMQGPGLSASLPVAKKAATVTVTPTATAKYGAVQPKNPYAKPPATIGGGLSVGHNKDDFNDDEVEKLLANVDVDMNKVATAHTLVAVGKAVGQSILAEAGANDESEDQPNGETGNPKKDEDYAGAN